MSLLEKIKEKNYAIPYSDNADVLIKELRLSNKTIPNRIMIQPMEGCDGNSDGTFGDLTRRRYKRFAQSGAGLIWVEACAIVPEGRANPRQIMLTQANLDSFKREVEFIKETSLKENGFEIILILQATHSGRYSKPNGIPEPIIAYNKPIFEKDKPISKSRIASDSYLDSLPEKYGIISSLAEKAGFDGIDIKCCHGYLMNELMSAYIRTGKYGGDYENRTRLFFDSVEAAKKAVSNDFIITSRMNVYDGFPYPYGFGIEKDTIQPDLDEPIKVIKTLRDKFGFELIDITIGNPYVNPHVNRPFNRGPYESPEDPLNGVERMMKSVGCIQKEFPDIAVVGSGFSYLGAEGAYAAAGAVENSICKIAGFGRQSFAYPTFARDILSGGMEQKKCCIACGKCSELMRAGTVAGCVIHDPEYLPYYQKYVLNK